MILEGVLQMDFVDTDGRTVTDEVSARINEGDYVASLINGCKEEERRRRGLAEWAGMTFVETRIVIRLPTP